MNAELFVACAPPVISNLFIVVVVPTPTFPLQYKLVYTVTLFELPIFNAAAPPPPDCNNKLFASLVQITKSPATAVVE